MRENGADSPREKLQLIAWVLQGLFPLYVFVFVCPIVQGNAALAAGYTFAGLTIVCFCSCGICTLTNAADAHLANRFRPESVSKPKYLPDESNTQDSHLYCHICESKVYPKSKHCKICNKCVGDFDHHCKWLNNCIGGYNYKAFLVYITSVFLLCAWIFLVSLSILIAVNMGDHTILGGIPILEVPVAFPLLSVVSYSVIVGLFAFLSLPAMVLLGQLWWFHMTLVSKGITTYDFILSERAKKEQGKLKQQEHTAQKASRSIFSFKFIRRISRYVRRLRRRLFRRGATGPSPSPQKPGPTGQIEITFAHPQDGHSNPPKIMDNPDSRKTGPGSPQYLQETHAPKEIEKLECETDGIKITTEIQAHSEHFTRTSGINRPAARKLQPLVIPGKLPPSPEGRAAPNPVRSPLVVRSPIVSPSPKRQSIVKVVQMQMQMQMQTQAQTAAKSPEVLRSPGFPSIVPIGSPILGGTSHVDQYHNVYKHSIQPVTVYDGDDQQYSDADGDDDDDDDGEPDLLGCASHSTEIEEPHMRQTNNV